MLFMNPFLSAIVSRSFVQIWWRCVLKLPGCSSRVGKWNTHHATSTCEITAGKQYRQKWRVFLVHLESWHPSQIQTSRKQTQKLQVEVVHMLMHNHNVQYPNLRDYRKIETVTRTRKYSHYGSSVNYRILILPHSERNDFCKWANKSRADRITFL